MREMFQLMFGFISAAACVVLMVIMLLSEYNFQDLTFALYFGIFSTIGALTFFVLTRNKDNEETNPGKEKARR
jgi:hypothetical protein